MDKDFDVVNCHEDFAYRVGYFYKKFNRNVRLIWSLNNVSYYFDESGSFKSRAKSYLLNLYKNIRERKYFRCVDLVTPLSRYEENWCKERHLSVKIIRSGLDFQKFFAPIKIPSGTFKLLCIGALGKHRRFEDAIYSVYELRNRGIDVTLTIVCKRMDEDMIYQNSLLELVRVLELGEHVNFLFKGLEDEKMIDLMRKSDVFVHTVYLPPPQYYGWGLVVFESMSAGLPVVLCSTTGATEVLKDGVNAVFARPMDSKDFANKIYSLLSDVEYYKKIAQSGQDFVKANISWSAYAKNMLKEFSV